MRRDGCQTVLEGQDDEVEVFLRLKISGGSWTCGLPADTETTGHTHGPAPGAHTFPGPAPGRPVLCDTTGRHQLLRNQPVNLQLLQIWSKPETFSDINITTANTGRLAGDSF